MSGDFKVLGTRAVRKDAPDKATGRAVYMNDMKFPGEVAGAMLQSPHAHANIISIDTSKAESLPGVLAVITAKDVPDTRYGVSPARYDENIFAIDKVRYVGDEIAAVAAVDLETALKAVKLIEVEYEILPALLTVEDSLAEDAPVIHEEYPGNLCSEVHQEFGDVAAGFEECDIIQEGRFVSKMQDGGFIETSECCAFVDHHGVLNLYSGTQTVHYTQRTVAMLTGLPMSRVRVVKPYVGGGFGPKAAATPIDIVSCFLAMKTGRPVRMSYTREQSFLFSRGRHAFVHEMKIGAKKDGTLVALEHRCTLDGGAYASFGIATMYYAGSLLGGPYKLPHMKYDGYRAYTNKTACGAQRGHGGVIARALFEQQLDIIAERLNLDPVEMRLKNMMATGDVTCNELAMSSLGMRECIEAVRDGSAWKEKKGKLPTGKGIGLACGFFVSGAGYPIYRSDTYHATVTIRADEDGGGVLVQTAAAEIGQGSDTTMAMIAAEVLGLPLENVRVVSGDSDYGIDLGAYSSRTTLMTGHATKQAAENLRKMIVDVVAEEFKIAPESITLENGLVKFAEPVDFKEFRIRYIKEHRGWRDQPEGEFFTFREASRLAYLKLGTVVATGKYKPPVLGGSYKGAAVGTSPAYGCSAQVAEVTVDMDTGQIFVTNITDAHDCGQAINRNSVEGQMEGSVSMGLGECLFEEVKFDDKGKVVNPSLGEYHIPTIMDMPDVKCIVVESGEPNGPFGAKEVGEGAIMPTIPAILNAVRDAVGLAIDETPLTPERVYMALKKMKEQ